MGRRIVFLVLLVVLVAGLFVTTTSNVAAAGDIRYVEAKLFDASPGYIVNFTGEYPGYGNMMIQYDNGTLHTMEILEEVVLKEFGAGDVFTYTVTDSPDTTVYRLYIYPDGNFNPFYIYVYGHNYTGTMGNNLTVSLYFSSTTMKIIYNGEEIYNVSDPSGLKNMIIEFRYGIYVDGNFVEGSGYFSYIWRIKKVYNGQPPSGSFKFVFTRANGKPEIYVDGYKTGQFPYDKPADIIYNGTHIIMQDPYGPFITLYTGTITYISSSTLLKIYYYMEPETTTITQTVTSTVTETETTTETVTQTINNTLTLTNTVTGVETLTVNNTITRYVPYYSGGSSIYLAAVVVFVIIMVLVGIAVSAGRGRGR